MKMIFVAGELLPSTVLPSSSPLHASDEAPRLGIADMDVAHRRVGEEPFDRHLHLSVGHPLAGDDPAVVSMSSDDPFTLNRSVSAVGRRG
jgi:hypothetical protein